MLSELEAYATIAFVVSNLGPPDFDPDDPSCNTGLPFFYDLSIEDLALAPTISAVSPSELPAGTTPYVWVSGMSFAEGLTPMLSGDGIEVRGVDFVDATSFGFELAVDANATLGARDLIVTNPDAATGTLPGAFTIAEDSSGCDCSTARSSRGLGRTAWSFACLALGAALLRRKRAAPCAP